ncbi:MAG: ArsR/SmtB family transcription factor [Oceanibaculum sp.]
MNTNRIAEIGLLVGEPARAAMLLALMDGRALTAGELAHAAGVTPPSASAHLARLVEAGLLAMERQGRRRYHRLASPEVARLLETVMQVAALTSPPVRRPATGPRDAAMRRARTCYDHMAGELGVALADALQARGHVELEDGAGLVTPAGLDFLRGLGLTADSLSTGAASGTTGARALCRPCLDWSERRPHIAGRLGAALCRHFLDVHLVRRIGGSRALEITPLGLAVLRERFDIRTL